MKNEFSSRGFRANQLLPCAFEAAYQRINKEPRSDVLRDLVSVFLECKLYGLPMDRLSSLYVRVGEKLDAYTDYRDDGGEPATVIVDL